MRVPYKIEIITSKQIKFIDVVLYISLNIMEEIPREVFCEQFSMLPLSDLINICKTCTYLMKIIESDEFWRIRIKHLFGTVNKLTYVSWKQLYQDLNTDYYIIKYNVNNKCDCIALSFEKQNGLMAIFTLYLQQNKQNIIDTEFLCEPARNNKMTIVDAFTLLYSKPGLPSLLNRPLKGNKVTPLDLYNLSYSKYELSASFRRDGTSIKLPVYGKSKSVMSYISKHRDYLDHNNKLWQLTPDPKYICIFSSPEHKPWIISIIRSDDFIEGIKLGCEILDLNYSNYLFAISEYKHYTQR